ncbi:sigma-E factor negative regulatory protein [Caldimonas tepidiphila]|uniref:sigma-E factor negative regulatory protein n=1 Tax=Caldimonas tepidiphila TaxID=2315841 RepID=UPI000E5AF9C9|nr:sigma-E factor negative regulatory protein [Caldimonas tepidiphila]
MSMSTGMSEQARERLSTFVDGEGYPAELQQMMAAGRGSGPDWAETLESWHVYHLIGDVMRSDELAGRGRDDEFLARLRERLADEPVVIAPAARDEAAPAVAVQPAIAAGQGARRRGWRAPLAAAAGVMVVAGVAVMTGLPGGGSGGALQALPSGATLVQAPAAAVTRPLVAAQPPAPGANAMLVRDARLEQYLAAHKQFGGSSALGVPSGFLRSATYEGPQR